MSDTLFFKRSQSMYPYWVNMPPIVPRYPASQDMFRREEPDKYTRKAGQAGYQNWTDKWYNWEHPTQTQEELPLVTDRHEPICRPYQFGVHMGIGDGPKWTKEGKDWPVDNKRYLKQGVPNTENHRARAIRELSFRDEKLYQFSNNMTSSYRKPVLSVYGPMLKDPVFGLTRQRNKHGNMPFEDYY